MKRHINSLIYRVNTNIISVKNMEKRIMLSTYKEMRIININEILYCESSNNYTTFYLTDDSELVVSKSLNNYNHILSNYGFYRIHSSILVNMKYIKSYVKGRGGYVIMENGTELDVSIRKKNRFLQLLEENMLGVC